MPHIPQVEKDALAQVGAVAATKGQICYLFYKEAVTQYNENPRWSTIHDICFALRSPYHTEWSHAVVQKYIRTFTRQDIETAAFLAFQEFYRLVASKYEDVKIIDNGMAISAVVPMTQQEIQDNSVVATVTTEHPVEACVPNCFPDDGPALTVPAKKRGRPSGSKNKPKVVA